MTNKVVRGILSELKRCSSYFVPSSASEYNKGVKAGLEEAVGHVKGVLEKYGEDENAFYIENLATIKGKKFIGVEYEKDLKSSPSESQCVWLHFSGGTRILIFVNAWGTVNLESD